LSKGGLKVSKEGILIAVEGMDGSGKSTQAKLLYHWLRAKGLPVYHTEWNSSTFHLIHAADFADRWAKQIEPVLKIGGIVICDRYKYTAMARDGSRGVPLEMIEKTYSFAREPDLTIYFDISVDTSYDRIAKGRGALKHYEAGMDMNWSSDPFESYRIFQSKVSEIYAQLVKKGRITRLDATGTVPEVQKRTRIMFENYIDLSNIFVIDHADRLAENLNQSDIDWLSYKEGVE
jgi:dTMP kinase